MSGVKTGYVETATGPVDIFAIPTAITAWNSATGSWTLVTLLANYFPATCRWLPNRGTNNAGETAAFPAPEAAALVSAGFAAAASGTPTQEGTFEP